MDFYDRIFKNPDYSDISSDEDEDAFKGDSDTIAYSTDEKSTDFIMISDDEEVKQEVYEDTCELVTRSIGLNMTSGLVVKDGDVINEQRTMEINVCENMDRQSANIFAQRTLEEISTFLAELQRQSLNPE